MHWYKRDPDAALAGMAELTLPERGAYNSLLDLLYSRDGQVPDDDILVARMMSCHWRQWKSLKQKLIEKGKIWTEDGLLTAKRVQDTLRQAAELSQEQRRKAAKRWHKPENVNDYNKTAMPPGNASTTTTTTTTIREREGRRIPADFKPSEETKQWAMLQGFSDQELENDAAIFLNDKLSDSSEHAKKVDWQAALRARMLRNRNERKKPNGNGSHQGKRSGTGPGYAAEGIGRLREELQRRGGSTESGIASKLLPKPEGI